jgi:hypothetical protein
VDEQLAPAQPRERLKRRLVPAPDRRRQRRSLGRLDRRRFFVHRTSILAPIGPAIGALYEN